MKKLLVYLIVFFSLFYFIDIVKAASNYDINFYYNNNIIPTYFINDNANNTNESNLNYIINYLNENVNNYNYIITTETAKNSNTYNYAYNSIYIYFIEKDLNNYEHYLYTYGKTGWSSYLGLMYNDIGKNVYSSFTNFNYYKIIIKNNDDIIDNISIINDLYIENNIESTNYLNLVSFKSYNNINLYDIEPNRIMQLFYYSNIDFKLKSYENENYFRNINILLDNKNFNYTINDYFIGYHSLINKKPEISFESINKYDDNELIKINFSIFDTDKYLYFYRTSNDNEYTWIEINQNDYYYQSYNNCTLYVIAIDKEKYVESAENGQELVYDIVSSSTYTFSQLNETIPELSFNTTIPDSCYLTVSDKENIICKSLTINILNNYSTEKYLWEYSKDNVNFIPIFTDSLTNIYSENITLYFRLLDKQKNEYIKYSSYKLYGITITSSELGPYIKLNGRYDKEKILYEITAYFYNKDFDNYNYFYTIDKNNWTQIQESQLNIYSGSIYNKIFNIYNNCTFIIKIEDKNGNYVNSFTFTVDFDKYFNDTLPVNKISSFLNNTSEEIKTISELIQYFYDGLDSRIQDFLIAIYTIILICSIIVLARS